MSTPPFRPPIHFVLGATDLCFDSAVFPADKLASVRRRIEAELGIEQTAFVTAQPATWRQLASAHTAEYLRRVRDYATFGPALAVAELEIPCDADTIRQYEAAVGATIAAARLAVETGGCGFHIGGGFHHAFADHGEGFCIFNDIAIAIRELQQTGQIRRAAVIDVDAHQGNGTADLFRHDPLVKTASIHNREIYPPRQAETPSTIEIGLPAGADDTAYLHALDPMLPDMLGNPADRPDLLIYVAGADPFVEDQLGGLALTKAGLRRRDDLVLRAAKAHGVPTAVVLAGGYARRAEDVVDIHCQTARACLETWGR